MTCIVCARDTTRQPSQGTKAVTFSLSVTDSTGVEQAADVSLGPYCQDHAGMLNALLVKHGISITILGLLSTQLRSMGFTLIPQAQVLYAFIDFVNDDPEARRASKAEWN